MSLRKGSITGSMPVNLAARLPIKSSASIQTGNNTLGLSVSKEYSDALNVLSEETMLKACALLLSDRDYKDPTDAKGNDKKGTDKSDLEQLEDLLKKCREAAKVIQKEDEAMSKTIRESTPFIPPIPPAPRSGSMVAAASRASQLAGGPINNKTAPSAQATIGIGGKTSLPPNLVRRAMMKGPGGLVVNGAKINMKRPVLERNISDSSISTEKQSQVTTTNVGGCSAVHNKKIRKTMSNKPTSNLSPGTSGERKAQTNFPSKTTFPDGNDDVDIEMIEGPPPSALHFLAKLNKDQGSSKNVLVTEDPTVQSEKSIVSVQDGKLDLNVERKDSIDDNVTDLSPSPTSISKRMLPSRSIRK